MKNNRPEARDSQNQAVRKLFTLCEKLHSCTRLQLPYNALTTGMTFCTPSVSSQTVIVCQHEINTEWKQTKTVTQEMYNGRSRFETSGLQSTSKYNSYTLNNTKHRTSVCCQYRSTHNCQLLVQNSSHSSPCLPQTMQSFKHPFIFIHLDTRLIHS